MRSSFFRYTLLVLLIVLSGCDPGRPVDFTFLGVSPDKKQISYQIKVNTGKPVAQLDLILKETDDNDKVLLDTTFLWQNIVHSVRQPIEKGKTYTVDDNLRPGATKAECRLARVIYQDGTSWTP
jgi:hypothetical protein